jgi:hypothetical protein
MPLRFHIRSQAAKELDYYDRLDYDLKTEFVSASDAWEHADFTLPVGTFLQIFDTRGRFWSCGFSGSKRYWINLLKKGLDEEEG